MFLLSITIIFIHTHFGMIVDAFNVEIGLNHITVLATKQESSHFGYSVAIQNTG